MNNQAQGTSSVEQTVRFVAYITLRNGKRIYASQYGKKAFPLVSNKPKEA